jgi:hypothetical protein
MIDEKRDKVGRVERGKASREIWEIVVINSPIVEDGMWGQRSWRREICYTAKHGKFGLWRF